MKHAHRARKIVAAVLSEEPEAERKPSSDLRRLWREYLGEHRGRVLLALVLTVLLGGQPFAFALTMRFLVDYVLRCEKGIAPGELDVQMGLLGVYVSMNTGIWLTCLLCRWVRSWVMMAMGQQLVFSLRERLHAKLQALHVGYYEQTATGKILARVLDDVRIIRQWVGAQFVNLATHLFQIVLGLVTVFYLNHVLALMALIALPLYGFAFYALRPLIRRNNIALRRLNSRLYARSAERVAGVGVVKAFGQENREVRSFSRMVFDMVRVHMRLVLYQQGLVLAAVLISSVATGSIVYTAVRFVQAEMLTLGGAMAFFGALASLFMPVNGFTTIASAMQAMLVVLRRVFALLDEPAGVVPGRIKLAGMTGRISFDDVTFTYPGQRDPALVNVSFDVEPGERIALMGPSGSGKSTIFQLLLRFYDPQGGSVRVGGVDLVEADPASVRWHVCMVQQEPVIFSGTIADNIMYGRVDASPANVMKAAEEAEMHEYIMSLPLKYETEVGEQGVTLSGGQKQRLSLATALLTDPEVLLLDDTTSALDAATEARIRDTLNRVMQGRTSLMITHRVASVREADRIIILEKGRVTAMGTHAELVRQDGFYRRICAQQDAL